MTLICSTLKWLRDHSDAYFDPNQYNTPIESMVEETKKPLKKPLVPWLEEHRKKKEEEKLKMALATQQDHERNLKERMKRIRDIENHNVLPSVVLDGVHPKRKKVKVCDDSENALHQFENEQDFTLKDYESDEDKKILEDDLLEPLLNEENSHTRKIYFCSRTHTQLNQFVEEVKKTIWNDKIRLTLLSSRKHSCIYDNVRLLSTVTQINEKCLDLVQTKKETSCPFHEKNPTKMSDHIMARIRDVEELVTLGKSLRSCPYYASRHSIPSTEIVVLPYQSILHKGTRESLGIDLRGQIVVFDEAHNLIETVERTHSIQLTWLHITQSHAQLTQYKEKYQHRLKAKNVQYIDKLLFILRTWIKICSTPATSPGNRESIHTVHEFLFEHGLDNINMFKLIQFMETTEMAKKVQGFCSSVEFEVKKHKDQSSIQVSLEGEDFQKHRSSLRVVAQFLESLTHQDQHGMILLQRPLKDGPVKPDAFIQYILLNPQIYFEDIVRQSHAVILAGGTMQPFLDFQTQILDIDGHRDRVDTFSCGHIVPPENIQALILSKDAQGQEFLFTHEHRSNPKMIASLGEVVIKICSIVPHGVILFFPSYQYEALVHQHWTQLGIIERIKEHKDYFRESKEAQNIARTLDGFKESVYSKPGAILSAVVGGKLSEGINFKDELGRCIIMVGMPYPNVKDMALETKAKHLVNKKGMDASDFYDTLCMKAVNQSIGRSIRHSEDYASILFVDKRFKKERITSKIPKWITHRLVEHDTQISAFDCLNQFFSKRTSF